LKSVTPHTHKNCVGVSKIVFSDVFPLKMYENGWEWMGMENFGKS